MIDTGQRDALIKIRLEQAKKAAASAAALIALDDLAGALNRMYYAMFYAVLALALRENFETSKHGHLQGWFNKNYIKSGVFAPVMFKMLRDAFNRRIEADYELGEPPSEAEIPDLVQEMKTFIAQIEGYIQG